MSRFEVIAIVDCELCGGLEELRYVNDEVCGVERVICDYCVVRKEDEEES